MIAGEEDYWEAPDGTRYQVGDKIPVLRINGLVLFNEKIIKGSCDMCDWAIIAPASLIADVVHNHIASHVAAELDEFADEFRHPDFTE